MTGRKVNCFVYSTPTTQVADLFREHSISRDYLLHLYRLRKHKSDKLGASLKPSVYLRLFILRFLLTEEVN